MIKVRPTGKYLQMFKSLTFGNDDLVLTVDQRIVWFRKNPSDTRLDTHPLKNRMKGKWAFSIDEDIRIVFKWSNSRKITAEFLTIGTHEQVYGRPKDSSQIK